MGNGAVLYLNKRGRASSARFLAHKHNGNAACTTPSGGFLDLTLRATSSPVGGRSARANGIPFFAPAVP